MIYNSFATIINNIYIDLLEGLQTENIIKMTELLRQRRGWSGGQNDYTISKSR
jgi:hypothetical protein